MKMQTLKLLLPKQRARQKNPKHTVMETKRGGDKAGGTVLGHLSAADTSTFFA